MRWVNHAGDDCTSDTGFFGKMLKHGEKIGGKVVSLQREKVTKQYGAYK